MGYQIQRQRNGQWCIWSTYSESYINGDLSEQEAIDYYVEIARKRAIEKAKTWIRQGKETESEIPR